MQITAPLYILEVQITASLYIHKVRMTILLEVRVPVLLAYVHVSIRPHKYGFLVTCASGMSEEEGFRPSLPGSQSGRVTEDYMYCPPLTSPR